VGAGPPEGGRWDQTGMVLPLGKTSQRLRGLQAAATLFSELGGRIKRKGEKYSGNNTHIEKCCVCSSPEGGSKRAQSSCRRCQRVQRRGKKNISPKKSENVWIWPFSKGKICPLRCKTRCFLYQTGLIPNPSQPQPKPSWSQTPFEMPPGPAEAPGGAEAFAK